MSTNLVALKQVTQNNDQKSKFSHIEIPSVYQTIIHNIASNLVLFVYKETDQVQGETKQTGIPNMTNRKCTLYRQIIDLMINIYTNSRRSDTIINVPISSIVTMYAYMCRLKRFQDEIQDNIINEKSICTLMATSLFVALKMNEDDFQGYICDYVDVLLFNVKNSLLNKQELLTYIEYHVSVNEQYINYINNIQTNDYIMYDYIYSQTFAQIKYNEEDFLKYIEYHTFVNHEEYMYYINTLMQRYPNDMQPVINSKRNGTQTTYDINAF